MVIPNETVASFTDAWIETSTFEMGNDWTVSHLLQMRGLKQEVWKDLLPVLSRIFYRCVD